MPWTLLPVVKTSLNLLWNPPPTQPPYQVLLLLSSSDHLFHFFFSVLRALTFVHNFIYVSTFSHAWSSWLRGPFSSCKEQGLPCCCGAQAPVRGGLSGRGCSTQAHYCCTQALVLHGRWVFPDQGPNTCILRWREDSSEYSNSNFINYISRYLKISSTTYNTLIVIDWLCLTILFCKWRREEEGILITEAWYTYQEYTTNCLVNFLLALQLLYVSDQNGILQFCKNGAVDFQMIPESERLLASKIYYL